MATKTFNLTADPAGAIYIEPLDQAGGGPVFTAAGAGTLYYNLESLVGRPGRRIKWPSLVQFMWLRPSVDGMWHSYTLSPNESNNILLGVNKAPLPLIITGTQWKIRAYCGREDSAALTIDIV